MPLTEVTLRIAPLLAFIMGVITARQKLNTPVRLVSTTSFQSSAPIIMRSLSLVMPALFTRAWTAPSSLRVRAIISRTRSRSAESTCAASDRTPRGVELPGQGLRQVGAAAIGEQRAPGRWRVRCPASPQSRRRPCPRTCSRAPVPGALGDLVSNAFKWAICPCPYTRLLGASTSLHPSGTRTDHPRRCDVAPQGRDAKVLSALELRDDRLCRPQPSGNLRLAHAESRAQRPETHPAHRLKSGSVGRG